MKDIFENTITIGIICLVVFGLHGCCKKIGLVQPDKCIEMNFTTIDNEIISGRQHNLHRVYSKLFYSDNNRIVEIKEITCIKYGYWYEK